MQTVHGVPMPVYRGFELLKAAGESVIPVFADVSGVEPTSLTGSGGRLPLNHTGPLTVMATRNETVDGQARLSIFVANFAKQDGGDSIGSAGKSAPVNETRTIQLTLRCTSVPATATGRGSNAGGIGSGSSAVVRTINSTCANPKAVWVENMNSVQWPTAAQIEVLHTASRPCTETVPLSWDRGVAMLEVSLEAYAVAEVAVICRGGSGQQDIQHAVPGTPQRSRGEPSHLRFSSAYA